MSQKDKSENPKATAVAQNPAAVALHKHLSEAYSLRPRRSKYTNTVPFKIADSSGDPWKWEASVAVVDEDPPSLVLILHSLPIDAGLEGFARGLGSQIIPERELFTFVIPLKPADAQNIRKLGGMFRGMATDRWGWLNKKVADALIRLANHLEQFRP